MLFPTAVPILNPTRNAPTKPNRHIPMFIGKLLYFSNDDNNNFDKQRAKIPMDIDEKFIRNTPYIWHFNESFVFNSLYIKAKNYK